MLRWARRFHELNSNSKVCRSTIRNSSGGRIARTRPGGISNRWSHPPHPPR